MAVIEKNRVGGTCVNVGCMPKKVMYNAASIRETIHLAKDYGFTTTESFDWPTLKQKRDEFGFFIFIYRRFQYGHTFSQSNKNFC